MNKFKIEFRWAVIFVAMSLLWMLLEKVSGLHAEHIDKHHIYTNLVAIPAIAIYVFALRDKRKNFYLGSMNYRQGLVSGLLITLIVTLFTPLTQYITSAFITPEYFPNVIEHAVRSGQMSREAATDYFSLPNYIKLSLISAPIMGVLTSLIVAVFTKHKPKQENISQPAEVLSH